MAVSINAVRDNDSDRDAYVGTIRDITAERAFAARENAVLRLATAVAVAKTVDELLSITLDECRAALDIQRVVAVSWPNGDGQPDVQTAGEPVASTWRELDPWLRQTFQDARLQLPLTAKVAERPDNPGRAHGLIGLLSSAGDLAFWLELRSPRWVSAEDRLLVTVLIGHLSLAMQHVRQFEIARETSLTLQQAMLPPVHRRRVSPCATSRRSRRCRSAGTGTTCCPSATIESASSSATAWDVGCPRPRSWVSCAVRRAHC